MTATMTPGQNQAIPALGEMSIPRMLFGIMDREERASLRYARFKRVP
jgi:hypothetical protein